MKVILKVLIIFILFLFVFQIISAETDNKITFIVLGHVYPDYEALELSVDLINEENPDFIVFLGDTLESPDRSWPELKQIIDKIDSPVYFIPGNHDISRDGTGKYFEEMSGFLFTSFSIKEYTFLILNTVTEKTGIYDISEEQVGFIEEIYEQNDEEKFIFMHNCLFYNYDNQFCNSREFFTENNWNSLTVPIIQNKTVAVFVGDVGINEPYFGYEEDSISYFGVGFSPKESQLKIPQHFLKVVYEEGELTVNPIIIRQDLTQAKYYQRVDKEFFPLSKAFIRKNLAFVLKSFSLAIIILLGIIIFLLIKLKKK